jgi:hypothetical protein
MSGIYSMQIMSKLPTIKHYIQLLQYIYDHIEFRPIEVINSIEEIQLFIDNFNIPELILLELIEQMSKYRFYIEKTNEYCNKLSLLQFFECISEETNNYSGLYVYNIFYNCNYEYDYPPIDIQYIRCFGKKLKKGAGNMDFRLLPLKHFNTLLKILQNDYVPNSRTFEKHKIEYTQEYQKYKYERDNYIYKNNSKIQLCKSFIHYYITNILSKNRQLELENINLQKKHDMLECLISML